MTGGKFRLSEEFLLKGTWGVIDPLVQFGDASEDMLDPMIHDSAEKSQEETTGGD